MKCNASFKNLSVTCVVKQIIIIFAMLLGVLSTYGSAEIIPYEPDMYNDSAGKRYGIHCLQAWVKPSSLGCIIALRQ